LNVANAFLIFPGPENKRASPFGWGFSEDFPLEWKWGLTWSPSPARQMDGDPRRSSLVLPRGKEWEGGFLKVPNVGFSPRGGRSLVSGIAAVEAEVSSKNNPIR